MWLIALLKYYLPNIVSDSLDIDITINYAKEHALNSKEYLLVDTSDGHIVKVNPYSSSVVVNDWNIVYDLFETDVTNVVNKFASFDKDFYFTDIKPSDIFGYETSLLFVREEDDETWLVNYDEPILDVLRKST